MAVGLACVTAHAVAQEVGNDDSADLVKSIMDDTYGQNYDARNACRPFTWKSSQGEAVDYCMRPGTPHKVDGPTGKTFYLNTFNATDLRDTRYLYSHAQPGLMGAFKVHVGGQQGWTYEVNDNAIEYGSAGDCGCANTRFVKLSNAGDHGWLFASGGTWRGVMVADYSIVTAILGRMKDVSTIAQASEANPGVEYAINVKEAPPPRSIYSRFMSSNPPKAGRPRNLILLLTQPH
jgi:hypothetical protein